MEQISRPLSPLIVLLTDFGERDGYVGVMKGVMLGIYPQLNLVDLTHAIAPQDVAEGAWVLASSYRYFPPATIFLCVVDPGVGSARRPIALHAGDWWFVGPDNGLFSPILAEQSVWEVVALSNPAYHLSSVSATFQGRDVFSPVAANLARGVVMSDLGLTLDAQNLQRLPGASSRRQGEQVYGSIVHIDHFGNLITNIPVTLVPDLFQSSSVHLTFATHDTVVVARRHFFAEQVGGEKEAAQPFLYIDSADFVGVAIANGNAAASLHVQRGECVVLVMTE